MKNMNLIIQENDSTKQKLTWHNVFLLQSQNHQKCLPQGNHPVEVLDPYKYILQQSQLIVEVNILPVKHLPICHFHGKFIYCEFTIPTCFRIRETMPMLSKDQVDLKIGLVHCTILVVIWQNFFHKMRWELLSLFQFQGF